MRHANQKLELLNAKQRMLFKLTIVGASILIVCLLFTGCRPPVANATRVEDLIGSEECARPCWGGIEPGISTADEVESALRAFPTVDQNSIDRVPSYAHAGYESISWTLMGDPRDNDGGSVYIAPDGIVESVFIDVVGELVLQDLIDVLGPPDSFRTDIVELPRTAGGG